MSTFLIVILVLIGLILIPFIFPVLSPIPYFPTNNRDIPMILDTIEFKNNQVFFDLGAGDGLIIFEAAHRARKMGVDTVFVAVEINPILVFIMRLRRFIHPHKEKIVIIWGDMFKVDYQSYLPNIGTRIIFYLYISPWFLEKTVTIIKNLHRRVRIISYFYPIHSLKTTEQKLEGIHKVYNYLIEY